MNMRLRPGLLAILVSVLSLGCGDDNDSAPNNANNASAALVATSYNVGLARGFVESATERLGPVTDAISAYDADVLCLQEVWLVQDEEGDWVDDQITQIVDSTAAQYPHNYFEITRAEGGVLGCTEEEVAPLEACFVANCAEVPNDELTGCVTNNCGTEFGMVSQECGQCLIGELGGSFEEIKGACVGGASSGFAYDGHNGLLLLSKHPLSKTTHTEFAAVQTARSVLEADVEHPDLGTVHVACTHLTADLSDIANYPTDLSEFDSYAAEQQAQVDALVASLDGSVPTLLLGDFNTGPGVGGNEAELPDNYQMFTDAGFSSPFVELEGQCTYCSDNTLIGSTNDKIIDHVFIVGDGLQATGAARVFDQTQDIGGTQMNLSDHYGVELTVTANGGE